MERQSNQTEWHHFFCFIQRPLELHHLHSNRGHLRAHWQCRPHGPQVGHDELRMPVCVRGPHQPHLSHHLHQRIRLHQLVRQDGTNLDLRGRRTGRGKRRQSVPSHFKSKPSLKKVKSEMRRVGKRQNKRWIFIQIKGHTKGVYPLVFIPAEGIPTQVQIEGNQMNINPGDLLITGSADCTARSWSVDTGGCLKVSSRPSGFHFT